MIASAPGKLVLLGEYAVVEGATAVVAAVDRRAVGRRTDSPPPPTEVVSAVAEAAAKRGLDTGELGVLIDTAAFRDPVGRKLGIGSSAAVAVVTAGLIAGRSDPELFHLAVDAHRAAAGGVGSGIDVAASFHGGVIAAGRQPGPLESLPQSGLQDMLTVLFTHASASTPAFVAACQRASTWQRHVAALQELADAGIDAWRRGATGDWLDIVDRYGRAMARLGDDAGVPIVTDLIARIMDAAKSAGAAAKPSGAGGGDIVVLFSDDPTAGEAIAEETGAARLDLAIDARGLVVEGHRSDRA